MKFGLSSILALSSVLLLSAVVCAEEEATHSQSFVPYENAMDIFKGGENIEYPRYSMQTV